MKKFKISSNYIIKFLTSLVVFISIFALVIFFIKFKNYKISDDLEDWANFSIFLTTLISFYSLIILGYITYIVSENTYRKPKKWEIYETYLNFVSLTKSFNDNSKIIEKKISQSMILAEEDISKSLEIDEIEKKLELPFNIYIKHLNFFKEFYHFIYLLKFKYSYILDEQLFQCQPYKDLVKDLKKMNEFTIDLESTDFLNETKSFEPPPALYKLQNSINEFRIILEKEIV